MKTSELYSLEELKVAWPLEAKKILVVGSQMAGTGIASRILGDIFNITDLSEKTIKYDNLESFFDMHRLSSEYILQCPGLTFVCHHLPVDLIVFMRRNYEDIVTEEKRRGWRETWAKYEVAKYYQRSSSDPAIVKDRGWRFTQKRDLDAKGIQHFDLWYESMNTHPFWASEENRTKVVTKK